jgi:hypothetical protein
MQDKLTVEITLGYNCLKPLEQNAIFRHTAMTLGYESFWTIKGVFGCGRPSRRPTGLVRGNDDDIRPVRGCIAEEWVLPYELKVYWYHLQSLRRRHQLGACSSSREGESRGHECAGKV